MNLDSITLEIPLENLDFDSSKYETSIKDYEGDSKTKFSLHQSYKPLGIGGIEILPTTNKVKVNVSAKVLQEEYLNGININTLDRMQEEINKYISISQNDIENAILLKADITENLYFPSREEKEFAIQGLKLGKSNIGFKVDDFTDKRESIIFVGRQTSYKNRQIYYNKEKELLLSHNKNIYKILANTRHVSDFSYNIVRNVSFKDTFKPLSCILRVEQNITSFDKLRQAIGQEKIVHTGVDKLKYDMYGSNYKPEHNINAVKLCSALTSNEKPLLKRHQVIMKYASQVDIFGSYDKLSYSEVLKWKGYEGMLLSCNSSIELMLDFVRYKMTKDGYKRLQIYRNSKEIQEWYSMYLAKEQVESGNGDRYFESLCQIEEMLRVA